MIRLAVIADPHLHDCGWIPSGSGLPGAVRSYSDTAVSTRVFNESEAAFRAALDRAVAEEARLVVLVGDLTDDGQGPNVEAALALLEDCRRRHGLRVFMTPGNHDFFGPAGRRQSKTFLAADGCRVTVSSDRSPDAATLAAADALGRMGRLGFRPDPEDLHWETPFGRDPDLAARSHEVRSPDGGTSCRMIDASYLVEPVAGLWILSLDANVCVPRNGTAGPVAEEDFHDPTDGGWTAAVRHRPHLLGWMADVARRARAQGKHLLAFSHYPLLDPLGGAAAAELALFGQTGLARRVPGPEVAEAVARTGVRLHFSGHLHVNDTARHVSPQGAFLNIAVPSPVGFPPAMKIVDLGAGQVRVRTLPLAGAPGHDRAFAAYRAEAARVGDGPPAASHAPDHGVFLDRHLSDLVAARYIRREWPADMAAFAEAGRMRDLLALTGIPAEPAPDIPLSLLAEDWYRLRKGGEAAARYIPAGRLVFYRRLTDHLPEAGGEGLAARFVAFLRILRAYLDRLPNGDFVIRCADLSLDPA